MKAIISSRLADLGLELPIATAPKYAYAATTQWDKLLFVSGQIPRRNGTIEYTGSMSTARPLEDGIRAAEICALNLLAQVEANVGLERIDQLLKINGYVSSETNYFDQPQVIDGASKLLLNVLGDAGRHSRTALGVRMLPANSLVEIEAVFGLKA